MVCAANWGACRSAAARCAVGDGAQPQLAGRWAHRAGHSITASRWRRELQVSRAGDDWTVLEIKKTIKKYLSLEIFLTLCTTDC